METLLKITNEKLYNEKVVDVDTELEEGDSIESTGEHGSRDYEEEYGFILECKED